MLELETYSKAFQQELSSAALGVLAQRCRLDLLTVDQLPAVLVTQTAATES